MRKANMTEDKILPKDIFESAAKQLRTEFQEIQKNNPHAAESGAEAEINPKDVLKGALTPAL